jgi:hypothetical protein
VTKAHAGKDPTAASRAERYRDARRPATQGPAGEKRGIVRVLTKMTHSSHSARSEVADVATTPCSS